MKVHKEIEKTTVCPCGHTHTLNPNPESSVYCGQCGCDYDRQSKVWRDPSSGKIIEKNTRLLKQRKGIEYGRYEGQYY